MSYHVKKNTTNKNRQTKSIQCTSCGAPLSVHGGGKRVRSLNCSYCGAVLDVEKEYRVLAKFKSKRKPFFPLELGAEGKLKGVDFVVIGHVEWQEGRDKWQDMLLYSQTHGYAWLTYEQGHYTFSHRVRDLPNKSDLFRLAPKRVFSARDKTFRVFSKYKAQISYVAGELTWVAKQGDSVYTMDAVAPPYLYSVEKSSTELEYSEAEYIEREDVAKAFKSLKKTRKSAKVHPAQPYKPSSTAKAMTRLAPIFAVLCFLMFLGIWFVASGDRIYSKTIAANEYQNNASVTDFFTITQPSRLVQLNMRVNLDNAWALFNIIVLKDNKEIFALGKGVEYYSGYDADGSWSEGSQEATAVFKVPSAGKYQLKIQAVEGGTSNNSGAFQSQPLRIEVYEGIIGIRYFFILALIFGILAWWFYRRKRTFEKRRWQESDA